MSKPIVKTVDDRDEEQMLCRISAQTFNFPVRRWEKVVADVGRENLRVIRSAGEVQGGLAFYRTGQCFGGRQIPMGGIALVCVAPEHRTAGLAYELMAQTVREFFHQGIPLSTLYPSTQRLYRKVGFEQAGNLYQHRLRLACIRLHNRPAPMRPVDASQHLFQQLDQARARVTNGCLTRSAGLWRRLLNADEEQVYAYLIGDENDESGYLVYSQRQEEPGRNRLIVRDMLALSADAAHSLWAFFYGHRTIFETVFWHGPAIDPLLLVPLELEPEILRQYRWMMRIVDVRKALSMRGYPQPLTGELHLEIKDDLIDANNGRFILRCEQGEAEVAEGGRGTLRMHVRGLAPLYSGLFSPHLLQHMGSIDAADEAVLDMASRLFAGPEPWMVDKF